VEIFLKFVHGFEKNQPKANKSSMNQRNNKLKGIKYLDCYLNVNFVLVRVIRSKNAEYPEGSQVLGRDFGWRNLTVYKPGPKSDIDKHGIAAMRPLVDMRGLPDSYALGAVGMPG